MVYSAPALGGIDADRFGVKRNQGWLFAPDIVDPDFVPTELEINAGQDLTCAIEGINGFNVSPRFAELPDLCSDVDGKVFDGASLDDSSFSFYLAKNNIDALDQFSVGDEGYVIHSPYGQFAGGVAAEKPAWVWKVEVSNVTPTVATAGGSMGTVGFAVIAMRKVTLPAEGA